LAPSRALRKLFCKRSSKPSSKPWRKPSGGGDRSRRATVSLLAHSRFAMAVLAEVIMTVSLNLNKLAAGLLAGALAPGVGALAAEIDADSRPDSVVVYPDSARVSRVAEVELPAGATTLVFRGLPVGLDPESLRVEATGAAAISIVSAQTRVAPVRIVPLAGSVAAKLREMRDQEAATTTRIAALEGRRGMVQKFADAGPFGLSAQGPLEVARWGEAWEAVGRELTRVGEDIRLAEAERARIREAIRALEVSNRGPAGARPAREAAVDVEASAPTRARIIVVYQVAGASWRPAYDARVRTNGGKADVELVRRALVRQTTGEDWSGVELAVSTARPGRAAKAPELPAQRYTFEPPRPLPLARAAPAPMAAQRLESAPATADAPPQVEAVEQEATLEAGAYEALFRAPGRVDAPGDGTQRSLRLTARKIDAALSVRAAPALDRTAYLEAAFVNEEEAPLLPGQVAIHRDGVFVGAGRLDFTAPGARARLGLGADVSVKIERRPVERRESEPGWLGSTRQETREFRTSVQNLHAFPVRAFIEDRVPLSENSAIVVERTVATPPPSDTAVDGRRGVLGWTLDLAPGETKEIRLGWRVRWPADRPIWLETLREDGEPRPRPEPRPEPRPDPRPMQQRPQILPPGPSP
jgi:uncharacterized protein (TIGR02231 family)